MSKKITYTLAILVALYLVAALTVFFVRLPSYSIQTSGKLYIVSKLSRDVQVVDLLTGDRVADFPIGIEAHEVISMQGKGPVIATNYGAINDKTNIIKVIDTDSNKIKKVIDLKKGSNANGIVPLKATNKVLLVDYINNRLSLLDIETDSIERHLITNQKNSHLAVLHPIKPIVYVTNMESNSVSVIDIDSGDLIKIIPCGRTTESIDVTPDGSEVWATNKDENSISIINTVTNEVVHTLPTGQEPLKLRFTVDGNYCMVANAGEGSIWVYEKQSKKQVKKIVIPGKANLIERVLFHTPRPVNILMHPNGLYAFVSNSNARKIEVIDIRSLEIVSNISTGKVPDALAFIE